MTTKPTKRVRCAVYTRVSTEYGLDQEFNSLDAQHEAAEAYIRSQAHDGWSLIRTRYDDGTSADTCFLNRSTCSGGASAAAVT